MGRVNINVLNLIRARIVLQNRTLTDLAPLCGISVPMLSMGLRGEKNLSSEVIDTLLNILNIRNEVVKLGLMEPRVQALDTAMILGI